MKVEYKSFGPLVKKVYVCWNGSQIPQPPFNSEREAIKFIDDVVRVTNGLYKKEEYTLRIES